MSYNVHVLYSFSIPSVGKLRPQTFFIAENLSLSYFWICYNYSIINTRRSRDYISFLGAKNVLSQILNLGNFDKSKQQSLNRFSILIYICLGVKCMFFKRGNYRVLFSCNWHTSYSKNKVVENE